MEFKQKYFNCLLLLRFKIIHKSKIFRIKKTAAFCVFCGLRYSSDNLLSFDTNALYFVRPLYIGTSPGQFSLLEYFSVADPACLFRIPDPNFSIPDPGSRMLSLKDPNSGSASKNLSILNQKLVFKLSEI